MSAMNIDLTLLREELEGCLHLGMEREALRLAARILRAGTLNAAAFDSALNALLICEDRLGRWRNRVESAFAALTPRDQHKVSRAMFNFHVSLNRWNDAARFMPRQPAGAEELLFSVWTLLHLRRTEEATSLFKGCRRRYRNATDDFERSCLLEAAGCLLAQIGEWGEAEAVSERGSGFWPFASNAWERLVKLHALRGLMTANEVFEFLRHERERMSSPNAKVPCTPERLNELDLDFHRHAGHLARVIPARERWQFGL